MSWKEIRIKDIGEVITGSTPPTVESKYFGGEYPFIKPSDLKDDERKPSYTEMTISDEGLNYFPKNLLPVNTTCVVTIGTIGKLCLTDKLSFTNQQINAVIPNEEKFDKIFIYYLLKMHIPSVKVLNGGSASGRENVNKSSFSSIKVKVPNLSTQKKIASVLSAYDDLIENNNQRIQLLEDMAQEIYKEWFVRFRFPNYQNTTFVDKDGNPVPHGTKGAVPKGWDKVRLDKYLGFEKGVEPGSKNYESEKLSENHVPFLRVGDLGSRDSNIYFHKELSKDKFVNKDDILITLDGTVGKVAMGMQGCYSSGLRKIIYKTDIIKRSFAYFTLLSPNIQGTIQAHAAGTTILHASSSIKFMKILLPHVNLIERFEDITNPMLDEVLILKDKNQVLQDTRDLLLPRLISGKLSVDNITLPDNQLQMAAEAESPTYTV